MAPPGQEEGRLSDWEDHDALGPDRAFGIDEDDINRLMHFAGTPTLRKGFVVIQSEFPLDVSAVYTVAAGEEEKVTAIEIRRFRARRV